MKKIIMFFINLMLILSMLVFYTGCKNDEFDVVHDFTLNKTEITVEVGGSYLLIASCGDCDISFSSDNEDVVSVGNDGMVTALKEGTAYITVSSEGSSSVRKCLVKVVKTEYSVAFAEQGDFTVFVGAYKKLTAITLRNGIQYDGQITFSVLGNGASIVEVDGYSATFVWEQAGTYEVVATDSHGKQAKLVVNVIDNA